MIIELKNISFHYPNYENVIDNLSLKIYENETIAIIGHNGSGKSTLAKIIMGLLSISKGEIYINRQLVTPENISELRLKMGIIFQNPDNQFVGVTVKEDMAFGLENRCCPRDVMNQLINEYATKVNMIDYLDRSPDSLSGGQKQRVALAGALALNNECIIFDEATSMLDPEGVFDVIQMIKKLQNESNKTLIIITHNLEEAMLCDRIIVLNDGKIVLDGDKKTVFNNRDCLEVSGLSLPVGFDLYHSVHNKKIKDAIWQYLLNM